MLDLDKIFDPDREPGGIATVEPDALSPGLSGPDDLPGDWRIEFEEWATIREYDGGKAREHAEAETFTEILARMRAAGLVSWQHAFFVISFMRHGTAATQMKGADDDRGNQASVQA